MYCPAYSASNTDSAQQNYANCLINASASSVLTISGCSACTGDQYLILYDANGTTQLASNDDYCSPCSAITYTVPSDSAYQLFQLHEGCYGSSACNGTISVTGAVSVYAGPAAPSGSPISSPASSPISSPSSLPTSGESNLFAFPFSLLF